MENNIGKEALLGQLRDGGFSAVVVNRLDDLLGMFGNNIPQFVALTKAALEAAYVKSHPGTKGLGTETYKAFEALVRMYKTGLCDARATAKAVVAEQERKEAEKARLREELLDRVVDFDTLTSAMAALGTLGIRECALGKLLEMYEMAKAAKGA
jgi:SOS response regulatory protein OraA/RecX